MAIMPEPGTGGGLSGIEFLAQPGVSIYFYVYSGDPGFKNGDWFYFTSTSGAANDAKYSGDYKVDEVVYQAAQDRWRIKTYTIGTETNSGS